MDSQFYYDDDLFSDMHKFYIRSLVGPKPTFV